MAPRGLARWVDARLLLPALIFTTAFAARLGMVYARGGSLRDSPSYDSSVYYAAADALLHGRLPYRDFTLLHPPAQMLALTPFAALGRVTTDHFGFVAGSLTWMALGATNSLLVLRIARRLQLGTTAGVVGAFAYALWYESTRSEFALRLEPFGNFLVLLAVLAYLASARSGRRCLSRSSCGAALGVAASVKIWYVVPLLIVLGWHLVDRRPRRQLAWAGARHGRGAHRRQPPVPAAGRPPDVVDGGDATSSAAAMPAAIRPGAWPSSRAAARSTSTRAGP